MVVTLIGYRGCGKSSIAPHLARLLGWSWADSDTIVEQRAGCSINDIFEHEGEAGFRRRESEVLSELLGQQNLVIASGGGVILAESNRMKMKTAGPVVWIRASVNTLAGRLANDGSSSRRRPSLTGKSVADEVAEVLAVREPLYRGCATIIVDAEPGTPDRIARSIAETIGKLLTANNPSEERTA